MFKRKRSPAPKDISNQAWLKWLVLIILVYAGYLHFTGKIDDSRSMISARTHGQIFRDGAASRPATPMNDIADQAIHVTGDISGTGDKAQCGQKAVVRVQGSLPDGKPIPGLPEKEAVTLPVGIYANLGESWKAGINGMSKGGIRQIELPAARVATEEQMKDYPPKAMASYKIFLDDLSPVSSSDEVSFLATDTLPGKSSFAFCGDEVSVHLRVWSGDGALVYSSENEKPLTFALGASSIAYGIDRGMIGMHEGGTRTIIIPPAYHVTAEDSPLASVAEKLEKAKMMVAEVQLVALKKGSSQP